MRRVKWVFHLSLLALSAVAQNRQPGDAVSPTTPGVMLRSTSRLVQISVVVHDAKGHPVRDLSRGDFTLTDEGRPSRIAIFHAPERQTPTPIAEKPQPLVISNRTQANGGQSPANPTIILFDAINLQSNEDAIYAKHELAKFLKNLHSGDPVALYALEGPAVRVLHDFSDDPQSLLRVAERNSGPLSRWLSAPADFSQNVASQKHIRTEWTLSALEAIAQHVAGIPGRKTLVWISSGFPITAGFENTEGMSGGAFSAATGKSGLADGVTGSAKSGDIEGYRERLQRLAGVFAQVDLAIYPIDPRGLATDDIYQSSRPGSIGARIRNSPRLQTAGEKGAGGKATMNLVALGTGGRAFYDANGLSESVQSAFDDSRAAYLLGFYPAETSSWDGKTHKIMVQVDRPGVEVLARPSYIAGDPPAESEPQRDIALQGAASNVLSATAIGLQVTIPSNPLQRGINTVHISVDPHDLRFEMRNGKWHADFDLLLVQKSPDGRTLGGQRSRCVLDRATYEETQTQTRDLSFEREVAIEDASSVLVLVRDSLTGTIGSVVVTVDQDAGRKPGERKIFQH